jgi:hypothetical protein
VRPLLIRLAPPLAAVAVAASGVVACAKIIDVESDRYLAAPIVDAGPPAPGTDWSCLHATPLDASGPGSFTLEYFLNDVTTAQSSTTFAGAPIAGAVVRACANLDLMCNDALVLGATDDAGLVRMRVPHGFDGYYEVTDASDFAPSILKRTPQMSDEHADQGLAKTSLIQFGAKVAHVDIDPSLGFVVITAADCRSAPASGVQFALHNPAASERIIYIEGNLPTPTATETDEAGSAIIFNVPPGSVAITGTLASTGETLRTVTALVRDGWATFVQVRLDSAFELPLE